MAEPIDAITAVRGSSAAQELSVAPAAKNVPTVSDKAELSIAAQAKLLKEQGATVDEIASQLDLPVATVLGDLGVTYMTNDAQLSTK